MDRAQLLSRLRRPEPFDLLVLGGGVTGAGIARDAALRGLSVALVEKRDLGAGTSSASSKLIHGGLRYLEQFEFGLVREGTRERAVLMRNAPHLARPLPFLFPIYEGDRVGPVQITLGMWFYDALAAFRNYRRHRMLNRRLLRRAEPLLRRQGLRAAARYYDCLTDDARLTLETALDAGARGAVIATYCEAVGFTNDESGRTTGLLVRDTLEAGGEGSASTPFEVRARVTVVAAGPWADDLLSRRLGRKLLRPTKGSHLVLDRARLPLENAVVMTARRDQRVLFAIPWGERTIVGTTDTDEPDSPDRVEASAADVDYLLDAVNFYFPRLEATPADVVATWSGLRPLVAPDAGGLHASAVSREHEIINIDPGLLAIAGGKLTTYRLMAEQVVDRAVAKLGLLAPPEPCTTETTPLPGAEDLDALSDLPAFARGLAREYALEEDVALHLTHTYGLRARAVLQAGHEAGVRPGRLVPGLPYLVDEVVHACQHEMARRLDDVLRRRTLVFLKAHDQGLSAAPEAARVMGEVLGWDAERVALEVARYGELVAASRAWKAPAEVTPPAVSIAR